jgi:iron(III) transport system permease protein
VGQAILPRLVQAGTARRALAAAAGTSPALQLVFWLVGGLLAWLVLAPLALLLVASVTADGQHLPFETSHVSLGAYAGILLDGQTWTALANSFVFAIGSTCVGLAIAVLFAWLIERTDMPWRRPLLIGILVPMAIPNMIYATAWIQLVDGNNGLINVTLGRLVAPLGWDAPQGDLVSLPGMVFVQGIALASHAYLLVAAGFRSVDPSWEEQSQVAGRGVLGTVLRVTLPVLRPALLSAVIFFLLVTVETFDIPGMIGLSAHIEVLSTRIYWSTHPEGGQLPDYGTASALAVLLLLISLTLIRLHQRSLGRARRFVTITARGFRPKRVSLGAWRLPLFAFALAVLLVMSALPLFMLVWRSLLRFYVYPSAVALHRLSLEAYGLVLSEPGSLAMLGNTAAMAITAAVVTVLLSAAVAWLGLRAPLPRSWQRVMRTLAMLPQAVPSVVLGFAIMILYLAVPIGIYGTIWIIALALVTKYVAYTTGTITAAQLQIAGELEEASLIAGASHLATWRRIVAPLLAPALGNCLLWVLIHAIRELAMAIMLYSPASNVMATQVWSLWEGGQMSELCALGVLATFVLVLFLTLPWLIAALWRPWLIAPMWRRRMVSP